MYTCNHNNVECDILAQSTICSSLWVFFLLCVAPGRLLRVPYVLNSVLLGVPCVLYFVLLGVPRVLYDCNTDRLWPVCILSDHPRVQGVFLFSVVECRECYNYKEEPTVRQCSTGCCGEKYQQYCCNATMQIVGSILGEENTLNPIKPTFKTSPKI